MDQSKLWEKAKDVGAHYDPRPRDARARDEWHVWLGMCARVGPDVLAIPVLLRRHGVELRWADPVLRFRGVRLSLVKDVWVDFPSPAGHLYDDCWRFYESLEGLDRKLCRTPFAPCAIVQAIKVLLWIAEKDEPNRIELIWHTGDDDEVPRGWEINAPLDGDGDDWRSEPTLDDEGPEWPAYGIDDLN